MEKIVYLNPDSFVDTDITVLKYLSCYYEVHWFYIYDDRASTCILGPEGARKYAQENNIILHLCNRKYRMRNWHNLFFYRDIVNQINRISPKICYYADRHIFWAINLLFLNSHITKVLGVHDAKKHSGKFRLSKFLDEFSASFIFHMQKHFVTFSAGQHDILQKPYGIESEMVGMSYKHYGSPSIKLPPIKDGIKILFFGSILEYKGLDILIEKLEKAFDNGINNLSLTIAGRGHWWSECSKLIKSNSLYNLQIRFIANEEIPNLMGSHHFLILPYRDATQSGPLATAIAYEMPIIAPNYGCFSDAYSRNSAVLYEQGSLYEALCFISEFTQADYESIKCNCRSIKESCSELKIASNYINLFSSL